MTHEDALRSGFGDFLFLGVNFAPDLSIPITKEVTTMLKIKVVSVGDTCCKVELTSEDGKDAVSVLHARFVFERGDRWVDAPNIQFSENLHQRIQDALEDEEHYREQCEEHDGR